MDRRRRQQQQQQQQQQHHHHHFPAVPKTTSVVPGAGVNIVLKADQPTGRTVGGVVRDVLTRGNHPRGIKVRLSDGRVGRVQSMLPSPTPPQVGGSSQQVIGSSSSSSSGGGGGGGLLQGMQNVTLAGDGDDHDYGAPGGGGFRDDRFELGREGGWPRTGGRRGGRGGGGGGGGVPRGLDEEHELPSQQIGLDAYVKEARPKRKGKGNQSLAAQEEQEDRPHPTSEIVTCPVCGAFEGDEGAVSHHVASHFDSAS